MLKVSYMYLFPEVPYCCGNQTLSAPLFIFRTGIVVLILHETIKITICLTVTSQVLTPLDTKETQDICAMSGFMRLSYYIRTGETNVCETYSTLYNFQNIQYHIEENVNFLYWFSMPTYTVSTIAGSGLPNPNSCGGGGTIFHALGPAGPFAKRHEQQKFQHTEKHRNDITARQKHSNCTSFCSSQ